jgi:hypothetical protein
MQVIFKSISVISVVNVPIQTRTLGFRSPLISKHRRFILLESFHCAETSPSPNSAIAYRGPAKMKLPFHFELIDRVLEKEGDPKGWSGGGLLFFFFFSGV